MKKTFCILIVLFLFSSSIFGQDIQYGNSFSYEKTVINHSENYEFYSSTYSEISLNKNWDFRVGEDQYVILDGMKAKTLIEFPLLFKYNTTNNISLLFGPKGIVLKDDIGNIEQTAIFGVFGVELQATKNIKIEGVFNFRVTNDELNIPNYYTNGARGNLKLGGKLKF